MNVQKFKLLHDAFGYLHEYGEYALDDPQKPHEKRTLREILMIFEDFQCFIDTFDVLKDEMAYFNVRSLSEHDLHLFIKQLKLKKTMKLSF